MDYRIVIETERSGKRWYYIQKRLFWNFWAYYRRQYDLSFRSFKVSYATLEEAKFKVQCEIKDAHDRKQSKIVKREKVNYSLITTP